MTRLNKTNITIVLACLIMIFCAACSRDLKLPDIKNGEKIVVLGELVAGDSVNIRAGRSISVSSASSLTFKPLDGLMMKLTDASGTTIPLVYTNDFLEDQLHTNAFVSPIRILAGTSYQLDATHSLLGGISATVAIPSSFNSVIKDTATLLYGIDTVVRFDVEIGDGPGDSYYVIEALKQRMIIYGYFLLDGQWLDIISFKTTYDSLINAGIAVDTKFDTVHQEGFIRQDVFTNDQHSENFQNGGQHTVCRRVLIKDGFFNGSSYVTSVFVKTKGLVSADGFDKGRVLIRVRSVSKDYFDYLKAYEQYEPVTGLGVNSLPVKIPGNINNGIGIIGGVYQRQFPFLFDRWEF
jgi:hypothetical protein